MIYAHFESILVSESNGNSNSNESYMNKYQNIVRCSFDYKLVGADDQFGKPFK